MKNVFAYVCMGIFCLVMAGCSGHRLVDSFDEQYPRWAAQYKVLMQTLPNDTSFPRSFHADSNRSVFSGPDWWCSGFYPGSLLFLYEQTKDTVLLREAQKKLRVLTKEQYNTTTHDLGFMMYCSFGNALRIAPDTAYTAILLNSARSLASRFNPKVGCIRSWNSDTSFRVIIDNMMNLELLFWATKTTGDSSFYRIAVTHANTTMQNHFRPDFSSYHLLEYDEATGAVKRKRTRQGYADSSAWARGQAWALYGYTVMYRETHDPRYLQQANGIAGFILHHPNLPSDKIPYWDFNAPNIPNAPRDASAAAITASALLELRRYVDGAQKKEYIRAAEEMLAQLFFQYLAEQGTNGGFLLQHSVGSLPEHSEIDVPLTYADYYFLEGVQRYKTLWNERK